MSAERAGRMRVHLDQQRFCEEIMKAMPEHFIDANVLDSGSLDINGNNRYLLGPGCRYTGVDIGPGKNVDFVCRIADFKPGVYNEFDTVVSTEQLEHDRDWKDSLRAMYRLVKPGGLLLMTCAGPGRGEHGTTKCSPGDSPYTNDYYQNLDPRELEEFLAGFFWEEMELYAEGVDIYFYGVKGYVADPKLESTQEDTGVGEAREYADSGDCVAITQG